MNNARKHSAFLVLGIFLLGACMRTPITAIPSIVNNIAASFHVPSTSLGILTTIPLICFGLLSVAIPNISQRIGNEMAIAIALVILFVGSWLRIINYSSLMIGTLLVGVGITFINVLLPAIITDTMPDRIGSMTSLYNVSLSLFSAVGAYAITPVANAHGWQFSVTVLSMIVLATLILWLPNLRFNQRAAKNSTVDKGINMWKNKTAWLILLYFGLSSFVFYTTVAWLPSIASSAGLSSNQSSLIAGLFNLFSIPGSFLAPMWATRMQNRTPIILGSGILAALGYLFLMMPFKSFGWFVFVSLILGLGTAATFSLIMTLFGLKTKTPINTSKLSGMAQSIGYILAAIGPTIVGNLKASSGSWFVGELVTLIIAVAYTIFGCLCERQQYVD